MGRGTAAAHSQEIFFSGNISGSCCQAYRITTCRPKTQQSGAIEFWLDETPVVGVGVGGGLPPSSVVLAQESGKLTMMLHTILAAVLACSVVQVRKRCLPVSFVCPVWGDVVGGRVLLGGEVIGGGVQPHLGSRRMPSCLHGKHIERVPASASLCAWLSKYIYSHGLLCESMSAKHTPVVRAHELGWHKVQRTRSAGPRSARVNTRHRHAQSSPTPANCTGVEAEASGRVAKMHVLARW